KPLEEKLEKISWQFGDGEEGSGKEVNHLYEKEGSYEVVLNLVSGDESEKITKIITVNNAPPEAVISSSKTSGYPPLEVEFDASQSSDVDDEIKEYKWDFGESTKSGKKVTKTFNEPGSHQVRLTVTDEDLDRGTKVKTIEVKTPAPKAVISASHRSGPKPLKVDFSAKKSTSPEGKIETYQWEFGDGNSNRGVEVTHTYKQSGMFEASLTVTAENGFKDTASKKINVFNKEPDPSLEVSHKEGLKVKFDLTNSQDPDGTIEEFKLDFGDGEVKKGTGEPGFITHTYEEPGVYRPQLTVTDDSGVSIHTARKNVEVGSMVLIDGEEHKCYPQGSKVYTENFSLSVYKSPKYKENIGGMFGKDAGEGAVFLLVPVKITNITSESKSLSLTTSWEVIDLDQGYTYEVATGADIYLDSSDRLETHRIPPKLSRDGYIVFEINETSRNNRLVLEKEAGVFFPSSHYFAINF
ncbi:PKD domain-containing protein, partial [Candidatus Bipolaricaulota bacterium]|nr:PKD domain-containing protein [Candidatus Bipolaricaulota bacterium]